MSGVEGLACLGARDCQNVLSHLEVAVLHVLASTETKPDSGNLTGCGIVIVSPALLAGMEAERIAARLANGRFWYPVWWHVSADHVRAHSMVLADKPGLPGRTASHLIAPRLVRLMMYTTEPRHAGVQAVIDEAYCPRCRNLGRHLGFGVFQCDGGCALRWDYSG